MSVAVRADSPPFGAHCCPRCCVTPPRSVSQDAVTFDPGLDHIAGCSSQGGVRAYPPPERVPVASRPPERRMKVCEISERVSPTV